MRRTKVLAGLRRLRPVLIVYASLGLALWSLPVLNILHVESSAVVAGVAFFASGLSSLRLFGSGSAPGRVVAEQEAALLIPWAMLTVSALWTPNCGYVQGLLFFFLFPCISVVLAVALAWALAATRLKRKGLVLIAAGLAAAVLGPVYDLGLHPQFYTYNHVFGGVLGPIYDEELAVRPGLFAFRALTLLWALLFFQIGVRLRRSSQQRAWRVARHAEGTLPKAGGRPLTAFTAAVMLLIGSCYLFSARLGINTPAWYLQEKLGGHFATEHFDIYYDPASISAEDLRFTAMDHEYQYHRLSELLDVEVSGRIASYIYPDAGVKAALTGARYTNVAPTWLRIPQTHVLASLYSDVFPHELAHVFSREFGLPVLNATLSVGLVEGFAVAVEPPSGLPSPHEQVLAALLLEGRENMPEMMADVASRLSPLGFWTGRGAVSYTTMGSFVRYLLDAYGPGPLKEVYALGNFEDVYETPLTRLAEGWQDYLLSRPVVAQNTADVVLQRFTAPSLFEVECPHHVPEYLRHYRAGIEALDDGDSTQALMRLTASLEDQPAFSPALAAWGRLTLARGDARQVAMRLDTLEASQPRIAVDVVLADAYAVLGDSIRARTLYDRAMDQLTIDTGGSRSLLVLRKAVAGEPEAVRILTSGQIPEETFEQLSELDRISPAIRVWQALELYEAGSYRRAADLLEGVAAGAVEPASPAEELLLERQRLAWLAQFSYRAGALETAEGYALRAAAAYRSVGDYNAAAAADELGEQVRWARRQEAMAGGKAPVEAEPSERFSWMHVQEGTLAF